MTICAWPTENLVEAVSQCLSKLQIHIPFDSEISLLEIDYVDVLTQT